MSFIKEHYSPQSLEGLCRLFGKTRQAFYDTNWREEKQTMENEIVLQEVSRIKSSQPRIGGRKLHYMMSDFLNVHQIKMGGDQLFDLLSVHGLLVRKRKRRVSTTNSYHRFRKYPNLVRSLEIVRPEQLWVSDITYIATAHGFCYLSLITDAFSKLIVGYNLENTLATEGCIKALQMALQGRKYRKYSLIHHSDRGIQYCSNEYVQLLQEQLINISMTEKGDPYENAIAERVNGILKDEFTLYNQFASYEQAKLKIDQSIAIYNTERPHASCNYLTPLQAHNEDIKLIKRWKNYSKNKTDDEQ